MKVPYKADSCGTLCYADHVASTEVTAMSSLLSSQTFSDIPRANSDIPINFGKQTLQGPFKIVETRVLFRGDRHNARLFTSRDLFMF